MGCSGAWWLTKRGRVTRSETIGMYVIFPSCTHWTASSMRPVSCFSTVSSSLLLPSLRQEQISAPDRKSALPAQPCGTERTKNTWETRSLLSSHCVPRPALTTLLSLSKSLNIQDGNGADWPQNQGLTEQDPAAHLVVLGYPWDPQQGSCHCHML